MVHSYSSLFIYMQLVISIPEVNCSLFHFIIHVTLGYEFQWSFPCSFSLFLYFPKSVIILINVLSRPYWRHVIDTIHNIDYHAHTKSSVPSISLFILNHNGQKKTVHPIIIQFCMTFSYQIKKLSIQLS